MFTADGTTASYDLDFILQRVLMSLKYLLLEKTSKNAISSYSADTKDSAGNFVTRFIAQDSAEGDITLPVESL